MSNNIIKMIRSMRPHIASSKQPNLSHNRCIHTIFRRRAMLDHRSEWHHHQKRLTCHVMIRDYNTKTLKRYSLKTLIGTPKTLIDTHTNLIQSFFSTQVSESIDDGTEMNRNSTKEAKLTLRRLARPFILSFHPDRHSTSANKENTTIARDANLKAIQTLNGMIDTVDNIYNRALNPKSSSLRGRADLQPKYIIEFLVPSTSGSSSSSTTMTGVKKPKYEMISTRRSVEITFSEYERNSINMLDSMTGNFSLDAAKALKYKAMKEIVKLLKVAGLSVPSDLNDELEYTFKYGNEDSSISFQERWLHEELGLQNTSSSSQSNTTYRTKSRYEEMRDRFIRTVDWKKHRQMYEKAVEDMNRDIATDGLIAMNEERRQRLISDVLSRVRVYDPSLDANNKKNSLTEDSDQIHPNEDDEQDLDPIQQLIAIRRMSLLLNDNFQELEMEEMGRVWQYLTLVLTSPRHREQRQKHKDFGKPFSRRKRLAIGRESGFKFSYQSDEELGSSTIIAYVPIDFTDDELIGELKIHLADFYNLCVTSDGDGGFDEDFFPSFYKQMKENPNFN